MGQYDHLPYRPGVGLMLLNRAGEVFVAKRIDTIAEAWQMPQGGIDKGEEAEVAALRELKEEIGTNHAQIIARSAIPYRYDLPDHLVPKIWSGVFRGQEQHWFVLRFLGEDSDINIATEHPEFSDWKWVSAQQLPNIIVPFKKELYQQIVTEFGHLAVPA